MTTTLERLEADLARAKKIANGPFGRDADIQRVGRIGRRIREVEEKKSND